MATTIPITAIGPIPYFHAKYRKIMLEQAPVSVAATTGTVARTSVTISTATGPQVAAALGALLEDLKTAGIIK